MSRAQDAIALLRAVKIVAEAVAKTQGDHARHLLANSSIRELLEKQLRQGEDTVKALLANPNKELEKAGGLLKETLERTAVVAEGLKQLSAISLPKVGSPGPAFEFGKAVFPVQQDGAIPKEKASDIGTV